MVDFKEINTLYDKYGKTMGIKTDTIKTSLTAMTRSELLTQNYLRDSEIARLTHYITMMKKSFEIYHDNAEFEIHELKRQLKKISTK